MRIASSVLDAHINDTKLEGEDVPEDVQACRKKLDGCESTKQACCFCQGLVKEAEAGKSREPDGPELCEMEEKEGCKVSQR